MSNNEFVVVKHGTSVVENHNQIGLDQAKIDFHVLQHMRLRAMGFDTTEVASGAVVEGHEYVIEEMGENIEYFSDPDLAIFGTARQLQHWQRAGRHHGLAVGQVLATHGELNGNIERGSAGELMVRQIRGLTWDESLIVTNENHAAALVEIEPYSEGRNAQAYPEIHGPDGEADNDWLAAHIAMATGATTLLLLTNVDGLKVDGKVMPEICLEDIALMLEHCGDKHGTGSGGMESKLLATERAAETGIEVIIGNAFTDVRRLLEGEAGTRVVQ
jgi:glutamate 5-kinase